MTTKWHGKRAHFALASQGSSRQGRMTRHRAITTATLMVLGLSAAAPAAAGANSLLSGYGGPGQGSQAILGSALLNGPGGGQGGGGASGGGSSGGSGGASGSGASGARAQHATSSRGANGAGRSNGSRGEASGSGAGSQPYGTAGTRASAGGSQTSGPSGAELLYILLAFGALALTAAITRRFARRTQ
jgi:hypothetical protein